MNTSLLSTENERLHQRIEDLERALREQQAMLDKQQQSLLMLHSIVHMTPNWVLIKDRNFRYLFANETYARAIGWTPEEIIGKDDVELGYPAELIFGDPARNIRGFRADDRTVLETGEVVVNTNNVVALADGSRRIFQTQKMPLRDADGAIFAVLGIGYDVTDQRQAEIDLHKQTELLNQLFDTIPVPIFYKDTEGVYLGCNQAFEIALGKRRDEIIGKTVYDLSPPDLAEVYHQADLDLIQSRSAQSYETEVLFADGLRHQIIFHKAVFLLQDNTAGGMVGTMLDISDIRQAERTIQQQSELLLELSTPLLQVSDSVLLMPLVGTIDSARAMQIMETLLEGIARHQAKLAIVDITGVQMMDTQVASALIQAAQAVRLLGAQVILTGISPTMAQTLVYLGADLTSIVTRGTLHSGITYALLQGTGDSSGRSRSAR